MASPSSPLKLTSPPKLVRNGLELHLHGDWNLSTMEQFKETLNTPGNVETINGSQLSSIDTVGAYRILLAYPEAARLGFTQNQEELFALIQDRMIAADKSVMQPYGIRPFTDLGRSIVETLTNISGILAMLGETVVTLPTLLYKKRARRPKEIAAQLMLAGLKGIPIVALVTLLIGVVVAYLFSSQAQKFGAYIFVVEAVSIAMCRELSPVIAGIIAAARSGSSYTAQLGAMKLNQEIDAIHALGLSPFHVLILPRVIALMLALPLLTFVGDIAGIIGGMGVSYFYLDITPVTFLDRLQKMLALKHIYIGLLKAPVFALVIAVIGCRFGFDTKSDARSVGLSTTSSVVYSVVVLIILDAAFAIFFQEFGW